MSRDSCRRCCLQRSVRALVAVATTGTYRDGILVLLFFFVAGGVLLPFTDVRRAIHEAGNEVPEVV